ncbi:hypothetical protein FHU41_001087 [Psychromicrobium silvestre]|uniref:VOC domain-containing protein n=1 Tax=Psychromicrobium silvestre TaxID=1645614 RepID=A0A7Y9S6Y4_9MICC|nr:hypothetical protein [Psychromicrobium silvestre]
MTSWSPTALPSLAPPVDGPFGRTFAFADLDGYQITLYDRA